MMRVSVGMAVGVWHEADITIVSHIRFRG